MATNSAPGQGGTLGKKNSLYSLAGYLELLQTRILRTTHKKFWFWFDEMTCSLKYYRNQETYAESVNEPIGIIDLSYAKVTPGITANSNPNTFIINVNGRIFKLCAGSSNEALTWVEKLQEKRGEYLKVKDMRKKTADEQEKGKKTLRPPCDNPVGVLHQQSKDASPQRSPPTVRRIVNAKITGNRTSLNIESGIVSSPVADTSLRRSTIDAVLYMQQSSPPPNGRPESPLASPTEDFDPTSLGYVDVMGVDTTDSSAPSSLPPQSRRVLELEAVVMKQMKEMADLQKENLRLVERIQNRNAAITNLNDELAKAREHIAEIKKPQSELRSEIVSLKNIIDQYKRSLQSLDNEIEIHKQSKYAHRKEIAAEKQRVFEIEKEMNQVKCKYVKLLSMQFKVRIPSLSRGHDDEDPELVRHTEDLLALTAQEGGDQQNYRGSFEDDLGDIHEWQNDVLTQRYLCRLLYLHYNQAEVELLSKEWEDYICQIKRTRKPYLEFLPSGDRSKKRELRALLRRGVPMDMRKIVWTGLVFRLVGKAKELRDAASEHKSYYWSLASSNVTSGSEKQIKIDLHRTLPNNKHFKLDGSGIPKLESVLLAFSRHDRNIGYCQSMNMIAALGLLFLDEETAFWLLVAVIEKLLPPNYYSVDLAGVQADQMLMGSLLREKLPRLSAHMEHFGIDVSLISLNWFLTIFIDAMPTQSALRVMDTFLLEGVKFLFRSSLAVFSLFEQSILKLHDQVALLQYCKEVPKHIFDMEALFQEIHKFDPFPNSSTLQNRHSHHLAKVNEQLKDKTKRSRQRAAEKKKQASSVSVLTSSMMVSEIPSVSPVMVTQRIVWECGCVCTVSKEREEVWLCGGEGKVGVVSVEDGKEKIRVHSTELSPRVICAHYVSDEDVVLVGTLDLHLVAVDYSTKVIRWDHIMNDSVLVIVVSKKGVVFVALADGFVAVVQDLSSDCVPVLIRIGSTAVSSMVLVGEDKQQLWCGCGKAITVLCTDLLEPTESLVMTEGRVNKLVYDGNMAVWVSYRSTSHLTLYHSSLYVPLLSIDFMSLLPPSLHNPDIDQELFKSKYRVTSMMMWEGHLWVGTGGGRVLLFSCQQNPDVAMETALQFLVRKRKEIRETSLQSLDSQDGGLLGGNAEVGKLKEGAVSGVDASSRKDMVPEISHKRQKTRFGRTLRNNKVYKHSKSQSQPDIFTLTLHKCSDEMTAPNDSVRILLPFRCGPKESKAISCVNPVKTEWQRGVQLWACSEDTPPTEWQHTYLSL